MVKIYQIYLVLFNILLLICYCKNFDEEYYTIRKISNGFIRGRIGKGDKNETGFVYLGIPYAKPPINDLRYKKPLPPDNWNGIKNVTKIGKVCLWDSGETSRKWNPEEMSEDCLQINVYTSKWCIDNGGCPVLLYLHGGQYIFGGTDLLNEKSLIENFANDNNKVVFTSINFRLGSLGYFSLNGRLNLSMDTNVALFDVLRALKWINKEIDIFGGNPGNVALMGHSAGATAAAYVYTSPRSVGLIHRIIFLGGPITYPYFKNANEDYSRKVSILANCSNYMTNWNSKNDIEIVLYCLRNVNGIDIVKSQRKVDEYGYRIYGPVSDVGIDSFMIEPWSELIKKRPKIPILVGGTKYEIQEGTAALKTLTNNTIIVDIDKLKILCRTYIYLYTMKDYDKGIDKCIEMYKNSINKTMSISDDALFFKTNYYLCNEATKIGGNAYLYKFDYDKIGNAIKRYNLSLPEPYHGNDLIYITGEKKNIFKDIDYKIQAIYIRMFINFLNNGDPSDKDIKFEKYNEKKQNYFIFDFKNDKNLSLIGMKNGYHKDDIKFWVNDIFKIPGGASPKEDESDWIKYSPSYFALTTGKDVGNFTYPESYWNITVKNLSSTENTSNVSSSKYFNEIALLFFIALFIRK
ncbi:Carboxylesterase, type B domain-containing protein [Strongyloides ratti]|uniref:Carboxylic ester hydrolase n=1 Tax=Strongyloides ratti TaxID=34506 RepID=A0A090KXM4_STRRB|nr:Carboxylesterase, type B domain-containing protein [Strongyloides ratti]CEF62235.1 Carboxylesterase, type B domain-containing protein [Strongyloides ratti]